MKLGIKARNEIEKLPFGRRPSKGMFGKKPSNGNFGKKPSKGNFGKPKTNIQNSEKTLKIPEKVREEKEEKRFGERPSKGMFGKKPSNGNFGKTPQKRIKAKSKKNIVEPIEQEFLNWLHQCEQRYPCFVCGKINSSDPIEWHHVKGHSYDKKNHKRLIPLCGVEHHRLGAELSAHSTPSNFRETFPLKLQMIHAKSIYDDFLAEKGIRKSA